MKFTLVFMREESSRLTCVCIFLPLVADFDELGVCWVTGDYEVNQLWRCLSIFGAFSTSMISILGLWMTGRLHSSTILETLHSVITRRSQNLGAWPASLQN